MKPTLETVKNLVVKAGHKIATSWEDEFMIYAGSVKSIPGCYGHPAFEVQFSKRTGWLSQSKQPSIKF